VKRPSAGALREVVRVQAETVVGEGVPTWSDIGAFRAATAPTRLGESEQIGAVRSQVSRVFQTWTAALRELNLAETHRLAWGGRAWNIREIRWPMGNEPMCDVVAESGVGDALSVDIDPIISRQPGTGNLIVSGYAPIATVLDEAITATPGTGALTATGFAPAVTTPWPDFVAEPTTGALAATGYAPAAAIVYSDLVVVPGAGALTAAGYAPAVQVLDPEVTECVPGTGALTATGYAPAVQVVEPDITEAVPGTGELTATGYAPIVVIDIDAIPATGALTATGYAPTVDVVAPAGDSVLLETGDALLLEAGGAVELDTSIPAQAEASALDGTEWTAIVQGGATVKVRTAKLAEYLNG